MSFIPVESMFYSNRFGFLKRFRQYNLEDFVKVWMFIFDNIRKQYE
jgi:hypothetical protein